MTSLIVLAGTMLLSALPEGAAPSNSDDLKAYQSARAAAGRDADAHVKLALWCESRGFEPERLKHLLTAVLIEPANATARGLLGLVPYRGKWEAPEQVAARIKADEALTARLAQYNARRDAMRESLAGPGPGRKVSRQDAARAHVRLGMWCEQNGLPAEARAHFTSAVVFDPYRDTTWKHLGYVKYQGRWMSPSQVEDEKRDANLQREADRSWLPRLKAWRIRIAANTEDEEALRLLGEVRDPRAVPAILAVFGDESEPEQQLAVRMLGQINVRQSTRGLTLLAVSGGSDSVRAAATTQLRDRDPNDFAVALVDRIHGPVRYQAQPVNGPGSPGALLIETPRFRMLRTYDAPVAFVPTPAFYGYFGYDGDGLPVLIQGRDLKAVGGNPFARSNVLLRGRIRAAELIGQANLKAAVSQQRLTADVEQIELANAESAELNSRVIPVLQQALDAPDLKDDEDAWHTWIYDQVGFRYEPPAKVTVTVNASPQPPAPYVTSCFAAGTPVRTLEGHRPIETLRVGDQVLSQDTASGALSFQPVQVVHHNRPTRTIHVALDCGDSITASVYHRFWRVGRGWAMARELETGDVLRTREGPVKVVSVVPGAEVPVYNLDVAETRTFFVGGHDVLVHDNRLPGPNIRPFDAAPVLQASRTADQ